MAERNRLAISTSLSPRAVTFIHSKELCSVSISDEHNDLWSFCISLAPGALEIISGQQIGLDKGRIEATPLFWQIINASQAGQAIGLVLIDPATSQRFRINGHLNSQNDSTILIDIKQVCPNCPKYIQTREPVVSPPVYEEFASTQGTDLTASVAAFISKADTFFVASRSAAGDHDASHRGGKPGFITISGNQLIIPDYIGNSMFMTLGNFVTDSAGGLCFVDFDAGSQLNLVGTTDVRFEDSTAHNGTKGRYWVFTVAKWHWEPFHPHKHWQLVGYSRFNP